MYERRHHRLISGPAFARRVARHFVLSVTGVTIALGIGIAGYHYIAGLGWLDALLDSSMILGGMGPVHVQNLNTPAAKLFASVYALFAGLLFVALAGVLLAPFLHRLVHRFHLDQEEDDAGRS